MNKFSTRIIALFLAATMMMGVTGNFAYAADLMDEQQDVITSLVESEEKETNAADNSQDTDESTEEPTTTSSFSPAAEPTADPADSPSEEPAVAPAVSSTPELEETVTPTVEPTTAPTTSSGAAHAEVEPTTAPATTTPPESTEMVLPTAEPSAAPMATPIPSSAPTDLIVAPEPVKAPMQAQTATPEELTPIMTMALYDGADGYHINGTALGISDRDGSAEKPFLNFKSAVEAAVASGASEVTLIVDADCEFTEPFDAFSDAPDIKWTVQSGMEDGSRATITFNPNTQARALFTITGGAQVHFKNLVLNGPNTSNKDNPQFAGRVLYIKGATNVQTHVWLEDTTVQYGFYTHDNTADTSGLASKDVGAGIYVSDNATVTIGDNCVIANNETNGYGGGMMVAKEGTVEIVGNNIQICNNSADRGGGINGASEDENGAGSVIINGEVSIEDNYATSSGGGIYASTQSNISIAGKLTVQGNIAGSNEVNNVYMVHSHDNAVAFVNITGNTDGKPETLGISASNEYVYRLIAKQGDDYTIVTEPASKADELAWVDDCGTWDIRYMVYDDVPGLYLYYKTVGATFSDVTTLTSINGNDINGKAIDFMQMTVPNSTTVDGLLTVPGIIPTTGTEDFSITLNCNPELYRIPDNESANKLLSVTSGGEDVPYEYEYDIEAGTATLTIKAETLASLTETVNFIVTADKYYNVTVAAKGPLYQMETDVTKLMFDHPQFSMTRDQDSSTAQCNVERPAGTPYQGVTVKLFEEGTTENPISKTTNEQGEAIFDNLKPGVAYYPVLVYFDKVKVISRDTMTFVLSTMEGQELSDTVEQNTTGGELVYKPSENHASLTNISIDGGVIEFATQSVADNLIFIGNEQGASTAGATITLGDASERNNLDEKHTQFIKQLDGSATTYGDMPVPVLTGYTFLGWYTSSAWTENAPENRVDSSTAYTKGASPMRLYAHWTANANTHYTIRHLVEYTDTVGGANCLPTANHATEDDATIEKNGKLYYVYTTTEHNDGVSDKVTDLTVHKLSKTEMVCGVPSTSAGGHPWWIPDGFTASGTEAIPASGTGILDLYYDRNPYKVIFENNLEAGTAQKTDTMEPKQVIFGAAVGELPSPTLPGYIFAGWHDEDSGAIDWTADTPYPTVGDTTIKAKWNARNDVQWAIKVLIQDIKRYETDGDGHKAGESYTDDFRENKTVMKNGGEVLTGTSDTTKEFTIEENSELVLSGFTYVGYSDAFDSYGKGMTAATDKAQVYIKPTDMQTISEDGTYNSAFDGSIVYLYYTRNRASVKYEDDNGDVQDTGDTIIFDGDFVGKLPDDIATDGYNFICWVDPDGNPVSEDTKANPYIEAGDELVLKPSWKPWTYQLTYVPGRGNSFKSAPSKDNADYELTTTVAGGYTDKNTVTYGQPFGEFPSAEQKGHNFVGWYVEDGASANVVLNATDTVSVDNVVIAHDRPIPLHTKENVRVLQAKYEPHTYTLKFDLNPPMEGLESSATPDDITVTYGQIPILPDDPTMSGYRFAGWVLDPEKKGSTRIGSKATAAAWSHVFTDKSTVTAYATWVPDTIVFRYDLNDQTGSTRAKFIQYNVDYGAGTFGWVYDGVIQTEAERKGYTFCGWALTPEATPDERIHPGDLITVPHNSTLYAVWSPVVYDVTMVMRGGTMPDLTSNEDLETYNPTATYDIEKDVWAIKVAFDTVPDLYNHTNTLYTPTKDQCDFHGWLVDAPGWPKDAAGESIHGKFITELPTYVDYEDKNGIILTAIWEPWFTFDPVDSKFTDDDSTTPRVIHQSDLETMPVAAKDGYSLDGWVDKENPDKLVSLDFLQGADAPMVLIPRFSANITFIGNGGKVNGKDSDVIALSKLGTVLPTATRSGYTHTGWASAAENGSNVTLESLKAANEPATVYAQWVVNQPSSSGGGGGGSVTTPTYTVEFDSNGGSDVPSQEVPSGKTPTVPETPTKPFYEFTGWYIDKECTTPFDYSKDKIRKNTVLYAGWQYVGPSAYLTTDHIAYIAGFPDGSVRPNAYISRGEVAMIFYRQLNTETRTKFRSSTNDFKDVGSKDWNNIAISTLAQMGILTGRGDGIFDPNANITRAEFAVICSRFDKLDSSVVGSFKDVPASHWAYKEIYSAVAKGWVEGYEDGSFRPDQNITRAETITLVNRVLGRAVKTFDNVAANGDSMKIWPDNADVEMWFYTAIQEATNSHDHATNAEGEEAWTWILRTRVTNS